MVLFAVDKSFVSSLCGMFQRLPTAKAISVSSSICFFLDAFNDSFATCLSFIWGLVRRDRVYIGSVVETCTWKITQ